MFHIAARAANASGGASAYSSAQARQAMISAPSTS
jgi:hypothetical protein